MPPNSKGDENGDEGDLMVRTVKPISLRLLEGRRRDPCRLKMAGDVFHDDMASSTTKPVEMVRAMR